MNYLARTVYPGRFFAAPNIFDKLAMGAAANVANINFSENDEARKTFSLPSAQEPLVFAPWLWLPPWLSGRL